MRFHSFAHAHRARHLAHRHGEGFGHAFGFRGHRRGGGRVFDQGDLRWVILRLIAEKPSHGYELIKAIEARLHGAYSPSPGVIYPTLTLLEDMGYIAAAPEGGARKVFSITPDGEAALAENAGAVDAIFGRVEAFAERLSRGAAPQIQRAMENLRTSLRLRLERGGLGEAGVARIAAALDAAALAIEKD
ncbi:MAG: PadR family transcriptional regulator [Alphaproteobacteria bacterium]|nr:PadR family transcriptional regulator [Alphaproteobacteria bacterium]